MTGSYDLRVRVCELADLRGEVGVDPPARLRVVREVREVRERLETHAQRGGELGLRVPALGSQGTESADAAGRGDHHGHVRGGGKGGAFGGLACLPVGAVCDAGDGCEGDAGGGVDAGDRRAMGHDPVQVRACPVGGDAGVEDAGGDGVLVAEAAVSGLWGGVVGAAGAGAGLVGLV